MNESQFSAAINTSLRRHGVHAWKIAAAFAMGVPDAWYSGTKRDVWVEYKLTNTTRKTFNLTARQSQWLTQRHTEGRACWLVVATPNGIAVFDAPPYPNKRIANVTRYLTRAEYIDLLVGYVGASTGHPP